ncbi:MAG: DUF3035 domain-containing protein [Paracoccaceae bacterium]
MRAARGGLALAGAAVFALAACGSGGEPHLMNLHQTGQGPDEFGILPPKALSMPENLAQLPAPTPGGANRTDPTPEADAIVALGGRPGTPGVVPASDSGLYTYATRHGVQPGIRQQLAAEDYAFREKNDGRLLERVFKTNVYFKAYSSQALDQYAELAKWRARGLKTPSAPPEESLKK